MTETLALLKRLIACPSVTPNDAGCQQLIAKLLQKQGFKVETLRFGVVDNLWARLGTQAPLVVFAGHTDVVPSGPLNEWQNDPFTPIERDGYLFGRGAVDMKGGLAAMIIASQNFLKAYPKFSGSLGFLITSDEEGAAKDGTQKVIETLMARDERIDYCIIGEPSSEKHLGDQVRVGRRGSLSGKLTIFGKQGHIAYPHLARNPIHLALKALDELATTSWDLQVNPDFPPTSFQISNIHAGTGATNVIPGSMEILFNFRFSTSVTPDELKKRVLLILEKYRLDFNLDWTLGGNAFLTQRGHLITATQSALKELTNFEPILSTGGGTSDGRFIAPMGTEVVELGPINATAHQIDECILISDLNLLTQIYERILERLLITGKG